MLQTQRQLRAAEAGDAAGAGGQSADALGASLAEVQSKLEGRQPRVVQPAC